jgi:hypothetical protein
MNELKQAMEQALEAEEDQCAHEHIQMWHDAETGEPVKLWSCTECNRKFEPVETRAALSSLPDVQTDAQDAARFRWYFSDKPKGDWLSTYLDGVRTGWTTDQWRAAIDAASAPKEPGRTDGVKASDKGVTDAG